MAIQLQNETDLLNLDFRKAIIEEIEGDENQDRKNRALKAYNLYKDGTKQYVLDVYKEEQGVEAFKDILYRATNISFARSIINKKAKLYAHGVRREVVGNDQAQLQLDAIVDELNVNTIMKKVNRFEELFKNSMVQIYPYLDQVDNVWKIKLNVLPPFKYDVIEDANNPEKARVVIFSYYNSIDQSGGSYADENMSAKHPSEAVATTDFRSGNLYDETIADSPNDMGADKKLYIWWSSSYHFTTDDKGEIIPGKQLDTLENPIGVLPFVNFSTEQDGAFWAIGGDDIIDGSILLNVFLTDLYYIAKYQGMGLFYLFGRGVPKNIKIGPSQAITLEVKEGDPTPQIGFATSNPPLDTYMQSVKEYISVLLKTNGLEPAGFMGNENAETATSGVQEMIKKSELIEDQEDKKEIYRDSEPLIFKIYFKWHNYLLDKGLLAPDLAELGKIDESVKINLKFNQPQSVMTELEKLEIIDKRQQLNLDTLLDSIMRDNPELSKEDAEKKLLELNKQRVDDARNKMMTYMENDNAEIRREGDVQSRSERDTGEDEDEQEDVED